ncbi:hypothetical protein MTQ13_00505 [Streptomyces sp. XM4011]|uniref:hypothetical protein n=1 Tax=Streptomyces sp. XM4011 TaxID=2929780 RepID=UPI001FFB59D4|nr:hypothetical protein [Streptomyces sp. XM4011]MCK1812772.1 hypothetical protein [Streptomyces sp. XM4011]
MAILLLKTPTAASVDLRQLSGQQLIGLACAVCGAVLRSTDRPRPLGPPARDRHGYLLQLWACAPVCRRRTAAAPAAPGGP